MLLTNDDMRYVLMHVTPKNSFNKFGYMEYEKVPISPLNYHKVNIFDTKNQYSYNALNNIVDNVIFFRGLVLTEKDNLFCIDIDNCIVENEINETALYFMGLFTDCYIEQSASRNGIHIIGFGNPPCEHKKEILYNDQKLELYTKSRSITISQDIIQRKDDRNFAVNFEYVVNEFFKKEEPKQKLASVNHNLTLDDNEIIQRALNSRSAASDFGHGCSFKDLYTGNKSVLKTCYQSKSSSEYDASSADLALASHLSFWSNGNHEQIKRIMMQSALVREKWKREDYLNNTIEKAISNTTSFYTPSQKKIDQENIKGVIFEDQQKELFKNFYWVKADSKICDVESTELITTDTFNVLFNGAHYAYIEMDTKFKHTIRPSVAFMYSARNHDKLVDKLEFNPINKNKIFYNKKKQKCINTFSELDIDIKEGDITPFLKHIQTLLPKPIDQEILLSYLALNLQFPGKKQAWCVVLQGVQGNGKTLIATLITRILNGKHCCKLRNDDLGNKFNADVGKSVYAHIDDVDSSSSKVNLMEYLKPLISDYDLTVEPKGVDRFTADNFCNFIFTMNNKKGVIVKQDERRYCVFFTAQQCRDDLELGEIETIRDWLLKKEGYKIVAKFLLDYKIKDEYIDCLRAPISTSMTEVFNLALSTAAQTLNDAIEDNLQGFKENYVSATQARIYLERQGIKASNYKTTEALRELGYKKVEQLRYPLIPEQNKRSVIYANKKNIRTGVDLYNDYIQSQGYTV